MGDVPMTRPAIVALLQDVSDYEQAPSRRGARTIQRRALAVARWAQEEAATHRAPPGSKSIAGRLLALARTSPGRYQPGHAAIILKAKPATVRGEVGRLRRDGLLLAYEESPDGALWPTNGEEVSR